MATLKGHAVRWGTPGVGATVGVIIGTPSQVQSTDLTWASSRTELSDATGETVGVAFHNATKTLTISVIPAATDTEANAIVAQDLMLLTPGTKVTVGDTGCSKTVLLDADYILESARLRRSNAGAAIVEMDLIQYSTDLSTDMA